MAERTFLYRLVEIRSPVELQFRYSGWWFRQTIHVSGIRVWSKISWLNIDRFVDFTLPTSVDSEQRKGRIEIDFSRGLQIRRFRIWIGEQLVYDEVD